MTIKTVRSIAFAAGCLLANGAMPPALAQTQPPVPPMAAAERTEVVTNGPQASPGDYGGWSARRDVIESERYERLLATNPAFRRHRMRLECGPITDTRLHEQCLASFQRY